MDYEHFVVAAARVVEITGVVVMLAGALIASIAFARRLVRDAPPAPVPEPIQKRLWNALAPSAGISVEQGPGGKLLRTEQHEAEVPPAFGDVEQSRAKDFQRLGFVLEL